MHKLLKNRRCIFLDKDKKESNEIEQNEDTTQYGEFISSYFAWLPPEKQKKRAKEINDMTKS